MLLQVTANNVWGRNLWAFGALPLVPILDPFASCSMPSAHTILLTQLLLGPPVIYLPDLICIYWYQFYSHLTVWSFMPSCPFSLWHHSWIFLIFSTFLLSIIFTFTIWLRITENIGNDPKVSILSLLSIILCIQRNPKLMNWWIPLCFVPWFDLTLPVIFVLKAWCFGHNETFFLTPYFSPIFL